MSFKLKQNLLINVINPIEPNKYSNSLLNLKTIYEIERKDKFKFPDTINELFEEIFKKEVNFKNGIHLLIIEKYFYNKKDRLNGFVCIYINNESGEHELQIPVQELYIELENFYYKMFLLASMIANYYTIEIKINDKVKDEAFA